MNDDLDDKKIIEKANKSIRPGENKKLIRFRPGRAAEGIAPDANGTASVDEKTAEYLVGIGYADYVN